jgi:hypothetical protein
VRRPSPTLPVCADFFRPTLPESRRLAVGDGIIAAFRLLLVSGPAAFPGLLLFAVRKDVAPFKEMNYDRFLNQMGDPPALPGWQ